MLLAVLPFAGTDVLLACFSWAAQTAPVAIWAVGLSALLGLVTWRLRAATPAAAVNGRNHHGQPHVFHCRVPLSALAYGPDAHAGGFRARLCRHQVGRAKKERLGTAERRMGRSASQVAANLGFAALVSSGPVQYWLLDCRWIPHHVAAQAPFFALALAALAEAAADTVSSEIGQVLGGRPRMITTLRAVNAGKDGAVSLAGIAGRRGCGGCGCRRWNLGPARRSGLCSR